MSLQKLDLMSSIILEGLAKWVAWVCVTRLMLGGFTALELLVASTRGSARDGIL